MEHGLPSVLAAHSESRLIGRFLSRRKGVTSNTVELKGPNRSPDVVGSRMQKLLPFFERAIPSDPRLLDAAVEEVTKAKGGTAHWGDVEDIALAVREALANAIIHGNDSNPEKTVEISVGVNENCDLVIIVKDSGLGFDPRAVPKPTVEDNVLADHGRGIFIIRLFMDQLDFKFDHGTEIYMRRRRFTNLDVDSRAD